MKLTSVTFVAAAALAVSAAACGSSVPPPTERLASSQAAARSARELGAEQQPQAALHLKLAEEQIEAARGLMKDKENKRADLVLQRASSDAELAVMITKETTMRAEADQARATVQKAKSGSAPPPPAVTPPSVTPPKPVTH